MDARHTCSSPPAWGRRLKGKERLFLLLLITTRLGETLGGFCLFESAKPSEGQKCLDIFLPDKPDKTCYSSNQTGGSAGKTRDQIGDRYATQNFADYAC